MVFSWIWALGLGKRVALYCSDVSGAFDRVNASRLIQKLRAAGVHDLLLDVLKNWLDIREATVCVDGHFSHQFPLSNMVFQGTVLGPPLWNCFFADASRAISQHGFTDIAFADDLNCFKIFDKTIGNDYITAQTTKCQKELHAWGEANQIVFEPDKESIHILDRNHPYGSSFKILSVHFDTKLKMDEAVHHFVDEAGWRLRTLLRTQRYHDSKNLIRLYKCHILSFLEGATPALYHAGPSVLRPLDGLQKSFLEKMAYQIKTL